MLNTAPPKADHLQSIIRATAEHPQVIITASMFMNFRLQTVIYHKGFSFRYKKIIF